jgi:hypothetical protein
MNVSVGVRFLVLAAAVALFVGACGGDKDPERFSGSAAMAVAQFWRQEADGGRLPEGTLVAERGTQTIRTLDLASEGQGARARVCVEYLYVRAAPPFESHIRVYIATLHDDEWSVESVNPDGTCEDVA